MNFFSRTLIIAGIVLCTALPVFAKVTVKNTTNLKLDVVIKDTKHRQNQSLNANEKNSFQCTESGGQMIILKKGDEVVKTYFDDGDKFIIKMDGEKIILKKDRDL